MARERQRARGPGVDRATGFKEMGAGRVAAPAIAAGAVPPRVPGQPFGPVVPGAAANPPTGQQKGGGGVACTRAHLARSALPPPL
eukprot:gene7832-biopygen7580